MLRTGLARATPTGPASSGGRSGRPGAVSGIRTDWRSEGIRAGPGPADSPDRGRSPRCAATSARRGCARTGPRALDRGGRRENRATHAVRLGEIAMARASLLRILCAPATAVVLVTAAGCGGGGVDEASDAGAVAAEPADEGVPPDSDSAEDPADGSAGDSGDSGGSGDSGDGAAGGPEVDAGGAGARPGGPFDIDAFEQVGQSYAEFLQSAPGPCDGVRCTLSYKFVDHPKRTSGCWVLDFVNDPPARP